MNKVVKYEFDKKVSVERILFRSALVKDCVRYAYSRKDFKELVVLDNINDVVDTREYLNGISY